MKIKQGSKVMLHYVLKADSQILEDTREEGPFMFETGKQMVLPKFEQAVLGLKKGDKITVEISPEEAYQTYCGDSAEDIPCYVMTQEGELVQTNSVPANIHETAAAQNKNNPQVDFTHPLHGKKLVFEIEILEVENPL